METEMYQAWALQVAKHNLTTVKQYSFYLALIPENPQQEDVDNLISKHNYEGCKKALHDYRAYLEHNNVPITWKVQKRLGKPLKKDTIKYIPPEKVTSLLARIGNPKHKLIIRMMLESGLRVSEVINTAAKGIILNPPSITGLGKNNKEYHQPITHKFAEELYDYAMHSGEVKPWHLNRGTVYDFLKVYAISVGISEKVSPHWLRHTYIQNLRLQGWPIEKIQVLARHSNINSTMIYAKPSAQEVYDDFYKVMEKT